MSKLLIIIFILVLFVIGIWFYDIRPQGDRVLSEPIEETFSEGIQESCEYNNWGINDVEPCVIDDFVNKCHPDYIRHTIDFSCADEVKKLRPEYADKYVDCEFGMGWDNDKCGCDIYDTFLPAKETENAFISTTTKDKIDSFYFGVKEDKLIKKCASAGIKK